jgi:hypothetical protein
MSFFAETFQLDRTATLADRDLADAWAGRLPEELLELWRTYGIGPVGDGLLVLIDPDGLKGEAAAWAEKVGRLTPFLQTAFLDLFAWDGEQVWTIDVHDGEARPTGLDMEGFLEFYLTQEEVAKTVLRRPLWEQARATLGDPAPGEGFIFVPALCLGGEEALAHVRRAQSPEALSILRNLHGMA